MKLFTDGVSNAKTSKSEKSGKGYATLLLHLAPAKESGYEVCASRSAGCTMACLYTAGRGRFDATKNARIRRTKMWFEQKTEFKAQITKELTAFVKKCLKNDVYPAVRMNGTSDIMWENVWPELFTEFPTIQFYDYTKHFKRCLVTYKLPANYHLTFSRSEDNDAKVKQVLKAGRFNVAVVFDTKEPPAKWQNFPTYSADLDDLRFLDPKGGHVGTLYAKGDGKKDDSGFVILT